jgi:hypothetical protein
MPTPAAQRPRPDLPPGTDLLPQIKHIVVLMVENHSYDNYLGMLTGRGDGFALGADGAPAAAPLDALDLDSEPAFLTPPALPAPSLAWGSR